MLSNIAYKIVYTISKRKTLVSKYKKLHNGKKVMIKHFIFINKKTFERLDDFNYKHQGRYSWSGYTNKLV